MTSLKLSHLSILALSIVLTSCGCSSEKGSDFFSKIEPQSADGITQINIGDGETDGESSAGGASSSGGASAGATSAGATSAGATSAGATSAGATSAGATSAGATAASAAGGASGGAPVVIPPPPVVVTPPPPSDKDICEPLKEEGEEIVLGYGLAGKLYDGAPHKINNFGELLSKGKALDGIIYMSNLNIPTRKFDRGFPRENGTMVMNGMGQVLIENFGIEFTGSLNLMAGDEEGYYEIGLIADDGVSLDMNKGPLPEDLKNIIDADHTTPTKFSCSKLLVRMEKDKPMPLRLRYFQGPRYHIALIMTWRKVEGLDASNDNFIKSQLKNPIKETRCGIAGNKFFFDPDSNSHPQMEYRDMLDPAKRAVPWKIVNHKNLKLPVGYSNMECVSKKP